MATTTRNTDSIKLDREALTQALATWDLTRWPDITKRNQSQLAMAVAAYCYEHDDSTDLVGFVKRAFAGEAIRYANAEAIAHVLGVEPATLIKRGEQYALTWRRLVEHTPDRGWLEIEFDGPLSPRQPNAIPEHGYPAALSETTRAKGGRGSHIGVAWRLRLVPSCAGLGEQFVLLQETPRDIGALVPSHWRGDNRLPAAERDFPLYLPGAGPQPSNWLCPDSSDVGVSRFLLFLLPELRPDTPARWAKGPTTLQPDWLEVFAKQVAALDDQPGAFTRVSKLEVNFLPWNPELRTSIPCPH